MPFIALIVGPYSVKGKNDSLVKIFHLKKNIPYSLAFKQVPCIGVRKELLHEMKKLFMKYKFSKDKIELAEKWTLVGSKEEKFIKCLKNTLEKNQCAIDSFDLQQEIIKNIKDVDAKEYFQH
jgi:hypothetical protein